MIVCVPAIPRYLHSDTVPSVLQTDLDCFVCNVEAPNSYFNYLRSWWTSYSSGFIIVEHDVQILPPAVTETKQDILNEMASCNEPWCCSPYNDKHLLGCTKFIPFELEIDFDQIYELTGGNWRGLDMAVSASLRRYGEIPHIHRRGAIHHHNYSEVRHAD